VQRLPLVLVVEYNRWAYSTPFEKQTAARTLADRAPGYGIPGVIVDGNDVLEVRAAAIEAVRRAREGGGPTLLECRTYRLKGHAEHDQQAYVDPEEIATWHRRDPIGRFERWLDARGLLPEGRRASIRAEVEAGLDADVAFAESAPLPSPRGAEDAR
jgi:TPP-dependent pyruvate/acetoin dehydrogenase alpha subunit